MTMRITMTQARMGEAGSILAAGSTYTVGDAFGAAMVGAGYATDTDAALRPPASALSQSQVTAVQALVLGAGNVEPAVRAARGYVVAADLRTATIAGSTSAVITDVERVAADGTRMRGIRLTASGGTSCSVDFAIRGQTFPTGRVSALLYADPAAAGGLDPMATLWVGDSAGFTNAFRRDGQVTTCRGWTQFCPADAASTVGTRWTVGSGTPVWGTTTFNRLRLRLDYTSGQTPWIEIYEIGYNEDTTSWVSISIDDGYSSAYTLGAPCLERYGMRGSFSVIADLVGSSPAYMTWDQLRDLRDRGHECVVHGPIGGAGSLANYAASPTRAADVQADLRYHRDALISQGLNVRGSANIYVYPQGYDRFSASDDSIRDALEGLGFVGARWAGPTRQTKRNTRGSAAFALPVIGHTWSSAGAEAANITSLVTAINAAAAYKYDAEIMLHKFVAAAAAESLEIQVSNLETILSAVADNRLGGTQDQVLLSRQIYSMAGLQRPAV